MAILYGTQSNGETLPVLVDQFGNLLAKGIDGEPGTPGEPGAPGAPGEPGAPGGAFPLPPDPYEGAFLGWLNNELAWIGTPPIPIAEDVFGPITNWDPAGLLTVAGDIPRQVAKGVHVYQCNEDGTIYVDGWNTSQVWSAGTQSGVRYFCNNGSGNGFQVPTAMFDGNLSTYVVPGADTGTGALEYAQLDFFPAISGYSKVRIIGTTLTKVGFNGSDITLTAGTDTPDWNDITSQMGGVDINNIRLYRIGSGSLGLVYAIEVDGKILVDSGEYPTAPNLNLRIQSVSGQTLLGVANRTDNFTIGRYLRVP